MSTPIDAHQRKEREMLFISTIPRCEMCNSRGKIVLNYQV